MNDKDNIIDRFIVLSAKKNIQWNYYTILL